MTEEVRRIKYSEGHCNCGSPIRYLTIFALLFKTVKSGMSVSLDLCYILQVNLILLLPVPFYYSG